MLCGRAEGRGITARRRFAFSGRRLEGRGVGGAPTASRPGGQTLVLLNPSTDGGEAAGKRTGRVSSAFAGVGLIGAWQPAAGATANRCGLELLQGAGPTTRRSVGRGASPLLARGAIRWRACCTFRVLPPADVRAAADRLLELPTAGGGRPPLGPTWGEPVSACRTNRISRLMAPWTRSPAPAIWSAANFRRRAHRRAARRRAAPGLTTDPRSARAVGQVVAGCARGSSLFPGRGACLGYTACCAARVGVGEGGETPNPRRPEFDYPLLPIRSNQRPGAGQARAGAERVLRPAAELQHADRAGRSRIDLPRAPGRGRSRADISPRDPNPPSVEEHSASRWRKRLGPARQAGLASLTEELPFELVLLIDRAGRRAIQPWPVPARRRATPRGRWAFCAPALAHAGTGQVAGVPAHRST